MKVNPHIFRTYDIRGIYPDELNEAVAEEIIKGYCHLYPHTRKLVVARDPRLSSPNLAKTIIKTLVGLGKEVIDIGIAPDPLFYFSIFHEHLDGGVMISGSHNPKEHNGLTLHIQKLDKEISEDVAGEDLEELKKIITEDKAAKQGGAQGKVTFFDPADEYISYVTKKIKLRKPLKIIIDSGNGACGYLPEKVFKKLGCSVKTIYGEFDGNFPNHAPDPYKEENLKDLKKTVLKEKADIGFAYDCDGDRIALVDRQGRTISGDFCLLMLARQALEKKKGPVIHDMRVSKAFLDEMAERGVKTYFSVSHHNAIIKKILETDAVFGGEITLHFLFPLDYYLCDEAIFASLKLAEIVAEQPNFIEYVDNLPSYYASPEVFIDTPDKEKFKIIEGLQRYLRENNYDFIDVDGARINFPNGWALARAANTTPIIKCRFEGITQKDLVEIEKKALKIFEKNGIPVTQKIYQELSLR